jgi:hypothetical protein
MAKAKLRWKKSIVTHGLYCGKTSTVPLAYVVPTLEWRKDKLRPISKMWRLKHLGADNTWVYSEMATFRQAKKQAICWALENYSCKT